MSLWPTIYTSAETLNQRLINWLLRSSEWLEWSLMWLNKLVKTDRTTLILNNCVVKRSKVKFRPWKHKRRPKIKGLEPIVEGVHVVKRAIVVTKVQEMELQKSSSILIEIYLRKTQQFVTLNKYWKKIRKFSSSLRGQTLVNQICQ